jgi:hypothetical protein
MNNQLGLFIETLGPSQLFILYVFQLLIVQSLIFLSFKALGSSRLSFFSFLLLSTNVVFLSFDISTHEFHIVFIVEGFLRTKQKRITERWCYDRSIHVYCEALDFTKLFVV